MNYKKLCQECNEPVPTAVWNTTQIKTVACATCREERTRVKNVWTRWYLLKRTIWVVTPRLYDTLG